MTVCFVCLGNTCRSAFLELRVRQLLRQRDITGIDVTSFGLSPGGGIGTSMANFLLSKGVSIEEVRQHHPRQFIVSRHGTIDLFLLAEYYMRCSLTPGSCSRAMTLRGFTQGFDLETYPRNDSLDVRDPVGLSSEERSRVYDELEDLAQKVVARLEKLENVKAIHPVT